MSADRIEVLESFARECLLRLQSAERYLADAQRRHDEAQDAYGRACRELCTAIEEATS